MKRTFILSTIAAAFVIFSLSSYTNGPVAGGAGNVTAAGCNSGVNCHGASNNSTAVGIVLIDKTSGQAVANFKYTPGKTYSLLLLGTNVSGIIKYGFQISSVQKASVTTQAGTFSNWPGNNTVHASTVGGLQIIEHSTILTGQLLNGVGVDSVKMDWKAPNAGAGTVRFQYALNAVNANGQSSGDQWNKAISDFDETTTAVSNVANNPIAAIFPVPAKDILFLSLKQSGSYTVQILDGAGKVVNTQSVKSLGTAPVAVSVDALPAGVYQLLLHGEGIAQAAKFVKQ